MKSIRLLSAALLILFLASASWMKNSEEIDFISIEKYAKERKLGVTIKSLGGHMGDCISMQLFNRTSDTLKIWLEAGRRLDSIDSTEQDIFLVKDQKLKLPPLAQKDIKAYGFCCQSKKHSPEKESEFTLGCMAPEPWIKLAQLINDNDFPEDAIQHAIWVMSDGHAISSIHDSDMMAIDPLRRGVAEIMDIKLPWYTLSYVKDSSMLFSNRPEKLYAEVDYYLKRNALISIILRARDGRVVTTLVESIGRGPGNYSYRFNMDVTDLPKGAYDVCVYEDFARLNIIKSFKL